VELEQRKRLANNAIDFDSFRREKYAAVERLTGRPLIVYATDFLNHAKIQACRGDVEIDLSDRDGFLEVTRDITVDKADVMIFSPGGLPDAADSLVHIIRSKFAHTRFIVPAIAKSAATMIALSGDELLMERDAELGPIDPQFRITRADGTSVMSPAQAIIDQFGMAQTLVGKDPTKLPAWLPILQQYGPSLYQQCLDAIELSKKYVGEWMTTGMFKALDDKDQRAQKVVDYLANHNEFKSHGARVGVQEMTARAGVDIKVLNDDAPLCDAVMAAHYAVMLTFSGTGAFRIIENSRGAAYIRSVQVQVVPPSGPHVGPGGGKKKR
jgi:serine dehydrogenase proteinase